MASTAAGAALRLLAALSVLATFTLAVTTYHWSCGSSTEYLSCYSVSSTFACEYENTRACSPATKTPSPFCFSLAEDGSTGEAVDASFCSDTPAPVPVCSHPLCFQWYCSSAPTSGGESGAGSSEEVLASCEESHWSACVCLGNSTRTRTVVCGESLPDGGGADPTRVDDSSCDPAARPAAAEGCEMADGSSCDGDEQQYIWQCYEPNDTRFLNGYNCSDADSACSFNFACGGSSSIERVVACVDANNLHAIMDDASCTISSEKPSSLIECESPSSCFSWYCGTSTGSGTGSTVFAPCTDSHFSPCACDSFADPGFDGVRYRSVSCRELAGDGSDDTIRADRRRCEPSDEPSGSESCSVGGSGCDSGGGGAGSTYAWQCYATDDTAHAAPFDCRTFADSCNNACGGALITRQVACKEIDASGAPIAASNPDEALCDPGVDAQGQPTGAEKPATEGQCAGTVGDDCEYVWRCQGSAGSTVHDKVCGDSHWSDCDCNSIAPDGARTRSVACVHPASNVTLSDSLCNADDRPSSSTACAEGACSTGPALEFKWSCLRFGFGGITGITCPTAESECSYEQKPCDPVQVYLSVGCVNVETNKMVDDEFCSTLPPESKPDDIIVCPATTTCSYSWKCRDSDNELTSCSSSHWSVCMCSKNTSGIRTRTPLCAAEYASTGTLSPVSASKCSPNNKPISEETCNAVGCPSWLFYTDTTFRILVSRGSEAICPTSLCEVAPYSAVPRCENSYGTVFPDADCIALLGHAPSSEVMCPIRNCAPGSQEYLWRCDNDNSGGSTAPYSVCGDAHWSECNGNCSSPFGTRYREISCVLRTGTTFTLVSPSDCDLLLKPSSIGTCVAPTCPEWGCYADEELKIPTGCADDSFGNDLFEVCEHKGFTCGTHVTSRVVRCELNGVKVDDSMCQELSQYVGTKPSTTPTCSGGACEYPSHVWSRYNSPTCIIPDPNVAYCSAARHREVECLHLIAVALRPVPVGDEECDPLSRPTDYYPCEQGLVTCVDGQGSCVTSPTATGPAAFEGTCQCNPGFYGPRCELTERYIPTYSWISDPAPECHFPSNSTQYCAAAHEVKITCIEQKTRSSTPTVVNDSKCDAATRPAKYLPCTTGVVSCVQGQGACATVNATIGSVDTGVPQGVCECVPGFFGAQCELDDANVVFKWHSEPKECVFPNENASYCAAARPVDVTCRRFDAADPVGFDVDDFFCETQERPPSSIQCTLDSLVVCHPRQGECATAPANITVPEDEEPALEGKCKCHAGYFGTTCEKVIGADNPTFVWRRESGECYQPEGPLAYCYAERPVSFVCVKFYFDGSRPEEIVEDKLCESERVLAASCEHLVTCSNRGQCVKKEILDAPGFSYPTFHGKCQCNSGFYGNQCESLVPIPLVVGNLTASFAAPYDSFVVTWDASGATQEMNSPMRISIMSEIDRNPIVLGSVLIGDKKMTLPGRDLAMFAHNAHAKVTAQPFAPNAVALDAFLPLPPRCRVPSLSCGDNGTCNEKTGRCDCKGDFSGITCATSPCESVDCNPLFSRCTITPKNKATCNCPGGSDGASLFRDPLCRTPVGCERAAICFNGGAPTGSFAGGVVWCSGCSCVGKWAGPQCASCSLQGQCGVHGAPDSRCVKCQCEPGYSGDRCDCRTVIVKLLFSGTYIEWFFKAPSRAQELWRDQLSSALAGIIVSRDVKVTIAEAVAVMDRAQKQHVAVTVHITDTQCVSTGKLDDAFEVAAALTETVTDFRDRSVRASRDLHSSLPLRRLSALTSPSASVRSGEVSSATNTVNVVDSSLQPLYRAMGSLKTAFETGQMSSVPGLESINRGVGIGLHDPLCVPSSPDDGSNSGDSGSGSARECPVAVGSGAVIEQYKPAPPFKGLRVGPLVGVIVGGVIFLALLILFLVALVRGWWCLRRCRGCRCCKRHCRCCRIPEPGTTKDDTPPPSPKSKDGKSSAPARPLPTAVNISTVKFNFA